MKKYVALLKDENEYYSFYADNKASAIKEACRYFCAFPKDVSVKKYQKPLKTYVCYYIDDKEGPYESELIDAYNATEAHEKAMDLFGCFYEDIYVREYEGYMLMYTKDKRRLSIALPEYLDDMAEDSAKYLGISKNKLINIVLNKHLANTVYELSKIVEAEKTEDYEKITLPIK